MLAQDEENYRLQLESVVKCKPNSSSSWECSQVCCLLPKTIPFPGTLPDCLISVFQGFSSTSYSANDASCVILACEMWTGLNFTLEDITEGKLKEHLQPEDYDLDKRVSFLCYLLCVLVFSGPNSCLNSTQYCLQAPTSLAHLFPPNSTPIEILPPGKTASPQTGGFTYYTLLLAAFNCRLFGKVPEYVHFCKGRPHS